MCDNALAAILLAMWLVGTVIASGFWATFFAITFFPFAWYLAMERFLQIWGVI